MVRIQLVPNIVPKLSRWYILRGKDRVYINLASWVPEKLVTLNVITGLLYGFGYKLLDAFNLSTAYIEGPDLSPDSSYGLAIYNTQVPPEFDIVQVKRVLKQAKAIKAAVKRLQDEGAILKAMRRWKLVYELESSKVGAQATQSMAAAPSFASGAMTAVTGLLRRFGW